MNEITAIDIIKWQNTLMKMEYSPTYLRMIQNQMTALFNHAERFYDLKDNPCKKVDRMGRSNAKELNFWTKDEYEVFIQGFAEGDEMYRLIFQMLFWLGCRIGEALVLTAKVNDYMNKAARKVIDYCLANDIGTLVVGYNETFQRSSHMGRQKNQNFVNIPYGQLRSKLEYLCELNGIMFVKQEESYTSKSSFWDKDDLPVYNADNPKEQEFSGNRIHRGLYRTAKGKLLNADVNGALNIMRKSNVVDMNILYGRGEVDTPVRIRIA